MAFLDDLAVAARNDNSLLYLTWGLFAFTVLDRAKRGFWTTRTKLFSLSGLFGLLLLWLRMM